jgi:hypothetical protein
MPVTLIKQPLSWVLHLPSAPDSPLRRYHLRVQMQNVPDSKRLRSAWAYLTSSVTTWKRPSRTTLDSRSRLHAVIHGPKQRNLGCVIGFTLMFAVLVIRVELTGDHVP